MHPSRVALGSVALVAACFGLFVGGTAGGAKPESAPGLTPQVKAFVAAQGRAKSVCAKAHAGPVDSATVASSAAAALRATGMNPSPWDHLANGQIVFSCSTRFASNTSGIYVDQDGHRTPSPPLAEAVKCYPSEQCRSLQGVSGHMVLASPDQ
jgi:hypothetical protein